MKSSEHKYGEITAFGPDYSLYTSFHAVVSSAFIFLVSWGGVRLSPLGTAPTTGLLYQPRMADDECGAVIGMRIGQGKPK
jgi:hypothetical protein